jgi:hypothetical protein
MRTLLVEMLSVAMTSTVEPARSSLHQAAVPVASVQQIAELSR